MPARVLLIALLCLSTYGCAETGHFVPEDFISESDQELRDAELVLKNESERLLVLELEDEAKQKQKLEVAANTEGRTTLSTGVYTYQLLISSRDPWDKKWFSHGPKGKLEASVGQRYTWTWTSAD